MRIAVLNTDTDTSEFAIRNDHDGQRFRGHTLAARPDWEVTVWMAMEGELPPAGSHDATLITGSPSSVNDPDPWIAALKDWIRGEVAARRPLFGACFGHQAIAAALGGRVGPSPTGWRLGAAKTAFAATRPWMEPPQEVIRLFCCNREQVLEVPQGVEVLGGDPLCPAASLAIGGHVFTTQYHPEMPRHYIAALAEEMAETVGPTTLAIARDQIAGAVDGDLFGEWTCRFFELGAAGVQG